MRGSTPTSRALRSSRATGLRMRSVGSETTRVSRFGRMWEIALVLREHGVPVRMLRSKNPGKVLYEDPYQIVVEEWKRL